jgi:uncharacterized membrane protein
MVEAITNYLSQFSPETSTFLLAMIPITELRASIPIAIEVFHLPVWKAILFSVLGDMLPVTFILILIKPIHNWVVKHPKIFGVIITRALNRAERKLAGKYAAWGALALTIFVAIPLPFTGAWTGSLAAFVFGVPFKRAFPLIFLGVIIAAFVVTLITLGADGLFKFFV